MTHAFSLGWRVEQSWNATVGHAGDRVRLGFGRGLQRRASRSSEPTVNRDRPQPQRNAGFVETPQSLSVIGAEQIRDQRPNELDEVLRDTAGVRAGTFDRQDLCRELRLDHVLLLRPPARRRQRFLKMVRTGEGGDIMGRSSATR